MFVEFVINKCSEYTDIYLFITYLQGRLDDSGKYLCWVNNSAGEETIQVTLTITAPLTAHLQPQMQTVDVDKNAQFQCVVSGHPVHDVNWLHDGKLILRDNRIEVNIS